MNEITDTVLGLSIVAVVIAAMYYVLAIYGRTAPEVERALHSAESKIDDLTYTLDATEELLLDLSMREHAARKEVEDLRHQLERFMRPRDARGRFMRDAA